MIDILIQNLYCLTDTELRIPYNEMGREISTYVQKNLFTFNRPRYARCGKGKQNVIHV